MPDLSKHYAALQLSDAHDPAPHAERPMTAEIADRMREHQQLANSAAATLHVLRDRLFDGPPLNAAGTGSVQREASSFNDAMRQQSSDLFDTLMRVDSLAAEIAARL